MDYIDGYMIYIKMSFVFAYNSCIHDIYIYTTYLMFKVVFSRLLLILYILHIYVEQIGGILSRILPDPPRQFQTQGARGSPG